MAAHVAARPFRERAEGLCVCRRRGMVDRGVLAGTGTRHRPWREGYVVRSRDGNPAPAPRDMVEAATSTNRRAAVRPSAVEQRWPCSARGSVAERSLLGEPIRVVQSFGLRCLCGGRPRNQANQLGSVCHISSIANSAVSRTQTGTQIMAVGWVVATSSAVSTLAETTPRYPTHPSTCAMWLGLARW